MSGFQPSLAAFAMYHTTSFEAFAIRAAGSVDHGIRSRLMGSESDSV